MLQDIPASTASTASTAWPGTTAVKIPVLAERALCSRGLAHVNVGSVVWGPFCSNDPKQSSG